VSSVLWTSCVGQYLDWSGIPLVVLVGMSRLVEQKML
jgi:hypothetical protein